MTVLEAEVWQDLISERCGLHFSENRLDFLHRRLWDRMRACQIWTYNDYYHYVAFNPNGQKEWTELLHLLLNNETSFFRHPPSFKALTEHLLPALMQEKKKQDRRPITIWSVGCSTGQEVYSLAMAYLEMGVTPVGARAEMPEWPVKITGSDLSQTALNRARRGRYRSYELRHLPDTYHQRYLTALENGWTGQNLFQVTDAVRAMTQFCSINLYEPDSYLMSDQDIIYCQNVLIYFKPEIRIEIVRRLSERLRPGGYLVLAPGEVVGLKLTDLRRIRIEDSLIYQRT